MADIDRIPSELTVGVFSDNLLNTQIDTQERIAALSNDFNVPEIQHSVIPKDLSGDDILRNNELPRIDDYLTSLDPKKREIGKNMLEQDAANNRALTQRHGLESIVPYQKGMEKFTGGKFGFDPLKTVAQNEDFYHENVWNKYSTVGQIWRGTGTFVGRTLSKLVTGLVGMVGDIGSMAWNGLQEAVEAGGGPQNNFWADVSDNWLARTMEEADQNVKDYVLPTYKALNYDDKGAVSKLFDSYFWTNDLADGAGFLLQFAIPGMLFGKAAQLGKVGKLGRFGRIMYAGVGQEATASRMAKGIGSTLEFLTGSRNVGGISAHVFNTTMESVAETKEGFNSTVRDLMDKGYSREEAEKVAAEYAPSQFGLNMAILSASNAFENKWFQRSIGNRLNPTRSSINAAGEAVAKPRGWVGNFFANNKWGNRIYHYGGNGAKASMMEGYWEENAQLAAQRSSRGEYTRKGEDTLTTGRLEKSVGFWKQLIKQTVDAANNKDREASDSIMAGAVIGILGGSAFSKFSGTRNIPQNTKDGTPILDKNGMRVTKKSFLPEGARRQEKRDNAELVAQVKNARDAWLSINVMPDDLYDSNGKLNEEKVTARVKELNEKLGKIASTFHRKISSDSFTDQEHREAMQRVIFGDYVKAHIMNGSADSLINRIKNWGNKTREELEMYGVTDEIAQDPFKWATIAQDMVSEYKKIDQIRFANPTDPKTSKQESTSSYLAKERAVKSHIFDNIAAKQSAEHTANRYAELKADSNPFTSVDEFNSYNNLVAKQLYYNSIVTNPKVPQEAKDFYKGKMDEVTEQIDMRKKSLPEHKKGNQSDMVFEKESDVDVEEGRVWSTLQDYMDYSFGEEDFRRTAEGYDKLIKQFSDPQTGISFWNQQVDYWNRAHANTLKTKLENMGYTKADITTMSPAEQAKLVEGNITKPVPVETVAAQPVVTPIAEPTFAEQQTAVLAIMKGIDDTITLDNLDGNIQRLLSVMNTPEGQAIADLLTPEEKLALSTYLTKVIEKAKAPLTPTATPVPEVPAQNGVVPEQTKPFEQPVIVQTEPVKTETIEPDDDKPVPVVVQKSDLDIQAELSNNPRLQLSFLQIVKVDNTYYGYYVKPEAKWEGKTIQQMTDDPVLYRDLEQIGAATEDRVKQILLDRYNSEVKPKLVAAVPTSLLDEVRKAYQLHEQALENTTSFKEEAEKENMLIHNNKIDNHVDSGKNEGMIRIVTSNPNELDKNGQLIIVNNANNSLIRFKFLDKLLSGELDKNDFKMNLTLSKENNIFGIVADKDGKVLNFDDNGNVAREGAVLFFYLDYDTYMSQNLAKRRSDIVTPGFPLAPLTAIPVELHPSFIGADVIEMLKDRIKRTTVTATMDFVTQGLLYRDGITNSYNNIPKNDPIHKASQLISDGHIQGKKGEIPIEDTFINGIYARAQRLQFKLYKDLNNKAEGMEIAEFRTVNLKDARNEAGERLMDVLTTTVNGKQVNIFQAAIDGNLLSSKENIVTLTALLRPDQFLVLNLGSHVTIINLKNFRKYLTSDNLTEEDLRSLTSIEDLEKSDLNITRYLYESDEEVQLKAGVLGIGSDNYSKFINNNAATSAKPVKKSPDEEGYARINKRIALTIDEDMESIAKAVNQKQQENKSPEVTDVDIKDELTPSEKTSLIAENLDTEEPQNLEDDFTNTECKV